MPKKKKIKKGKTKNEKDNNSGIPLITVQVPSDPENDVIEEFADEKDQTPKYLQVPLALRFAETMDLQAMTLTTHRRKKKKKSIKKKEDKPKDMTIHDSLQEQLRKLGITRPFVAFASPPDLEMYKKTVCFHVVCSSSFTHQYILDNIRYQLRSLEEAKVEYIQYINRSVKYGASCLEDRWLVGVNSEEAKEHLVQHGLILLNRTVHVKRYPDILEDEYEHFLQYERIVKNINLGKIAMKKNKVKDKTEKARFLATNLLTNFEETTGSGDPDEIYGPFGRVPKAQSGTAKGSKTAP